MKTDTELPLGKEAARRKRRSGEWILLLTVLFSPSCSHRFFQQRLSGEVNSSTKGGISRLCNTSRTARTRQQFRRTAKLSPYMSTSTQAKLPSTRMTPSRIYGSAYKTKVAGRITHRFTTRNGAYFRSALW